MWITFFSSENYSTCILVYYVGFALLCCVCFNQLIKKKPLTTQDPQPNLILSIQLL